MNPGGIIDFYDDLDGSVLKSKVPLESLPPYIKQAEFKTREKLAALHDDAFAVVLVDAGKKLRKFACVDKGNTALSVIYFLENKDKLTKEAQRVAAGNLVDACVEFDLDPPMALKMAAGRPLRQKKAELSGTDVMPLQASHPKYDAGEEEIPISSDTKRASAEASTVERYVDITGQRPEGLRKHASIKSYCLEKNGTGMFPIDSYGDVLEANRWFEENRIKLSPEDRKEYCTKLAARANEIGIEVTDNVRKYASTSFADRDSVELAVAGRMQFWAEDSPERDLLTGLMGKYASVEPDVFCAALKQFDVLTGLDYAWDKEILDPVYSTYGFEKKAEWSWAQDADVLTEEQLRRGVQDSVKIHQIKARFGAEVAGGLVENPTGIFDSLPMDSKRIICRIVQDTQ